MHTKTRFAFWTGNYLGSSGLFIPSLCLILVFDLLVFSYSVPSPSLYYIFYQVVP